MGKKLKKQLAETNTNYENLLKDYEALQAKQKQESQEKQKQEKSLNESFNALKKNLRALEKQIPMPLVPLVCLWCLWYAFGALVCLWVPLVCLWCLWCDSLPLLERLPSTMCVPANVKLTKVDEGAILSWFFPVAEVIEYEVNLDCNGVIFTGYKGKEPKCYIYNGQLSEVLSFLQKVKHYFI